MAAEHFGSSAYFTVVAELARGIGRPFRTAFLFHKVYEWLHPN